MTTERTRGDELIERILAEGDNGQMSADLLNECFHGYPVDNLLRLLRSDNDEAAKAGAFVAEELGPESRPLLPEVVRLLGHRNRNVRYDMLTTVLLAATPSNGEAIAKAITLVNDSERIVRSNALDFLARADQSQLSAAVTHLMEPKIKTRLGWLLEVEESPNADALVDLGLVEEDRLSRWFAGAAAVRMYQRNPRLLDHAAESDDVELKAFAEFQRQWFQAGSAS